jgi:hypothetical protein
LEVIGQLHSQAELSYRRESPQHPSYRRLGRPSADMDAVKKRKIFPITENEQQLTP